MAKKMDLKPWKLGGAIIETLMGIPFVGGLIILGSGWTLLGLALVLHIVILVFSAQNKTKKTAPIMGIVTNALGWIPVVGMILHIITAVLYWMDWSRS